MRILVVGNYEPDGSKSMPRYAAWIERTLVERGHLVDITKPRPVFSLLASRFAPHPALIKYLGYLDKFLIFPFRLHHLARKYDLVHVADHSNSMYLSVVRKRPNLITCHDVLAIRHAKDEFLPFTTGWSGRILQSWILSGLRRARHVLCVSNKTADDLKRLASQAGPRIRVIHNALNWSYRPDAALPDSLVARIGLKPKETYILHVGGDSWYKNRLGVIRIFAHMAKMDQFSAVRLILAGAPWSVTLRNLVHEERLSDRVIEAGGVTNDELQALYSNALALLFPSLEEGFGWPIIEAQACGCPVITTGRPPMSEIAGNAAIFIDPADPESAAHAIAVGLLGREQLRSAGFRNLKNFDEVGIADAYCHYYEAILAGSLAPDSAPRPCP